jgi:REP element-mobilizing transposase RayT
VGIHVCRGAHCASEVIKARPKLSNGRPRLSNEGVTVEKAIENVSKIYRNIKIDKYVIMPSHVHMIVAIQESNGPCLESNGRAMRAPTISGIINQMKGYTTKQIGYSIWQKLFHDHIIRNENEYKKIAEYIENNPANWEDDDLYPSTI